MTTSFFDRLRRNKWNFLCLAGCLAVLISILEIVLRIPMRESMPTYYYGLAGEVWDEDADMFWTPRHQYKAELAKLPRFDSNHLIYTFGGSIPTNHTANTNFPAELEKLLAPNYAVANFATGGYSSRQSLVLSRKMIKRKTPHLLIVCHGYNDHGLSIASDRDMARRNHRASVRLLHFISGSRIVQAARRLAWVTMGYDPYNLNPKAKNIRLRVSPDDYEDNLRGFLREARENKIQVVFMTQAVIDAAVARDTDPYFIVMRAVAARTPKAHFLDVRGAVEAYYKEHLGYMPDHRTPDKSSDMLLHNDTCHLSDDGHRLIATLLYDFLMTNGLTP